MTGQSVTFTATVSATSPGSGTPTGIVQFKDGSGTLATCGAVALSAGSATCSASFNASASPRTISAVYAGDNDYLTSTSSNLSQVINKASTTTAVASLANPSVTGQSVTFTATVSAVSPGSGTPTGTIQFKDGVATLGSCSAQTMSAGSATCSASFPATASPRTISAVYAGESNFVTSTSSNLTQTINPASTSTALASSANPSVTGQSVTFTATVSATSPGSGTPSGTVNFKDGGNTISGCGTQTLNGSGVATCASTMTTGSHTITAVYSGDSNFSASTSGGLTQSANIFAGIDFVKTSSGGALGCTYTAITAVTCSLTGLGNGGATVTGNIRLIDASHNAVTNSGSAISVAYTLGGQAVGLTPASPQSIANGSSQTPSIQFQMNNGSNKTGTLTATVTLNSAPTP